MTPHTPPRPCINFPKAVLGPALPRSRLPRPGVRPAGPRGEAPRRRPKAAEAASQGGLPCGPFGSRPHPQKRKEPFHVSFLPLS